MVIHFFIKSCSLFHAPIFPFKPSCSLTVSGPTSVSSTWKGEGSLAVECFMLIATKIRHLWSEVQNQQEEQSHVPWKTQSHWEDGKKQLLCSKSRQLVHSSSGSQHTSQGLCDIWLTCFSFSSLFLSHQEKAVHAAPSCHANYSKGIMTLTPFQCWLGWEPIRQMGKTWEILDCNFENWHLKSQKLIFASSLDFHIAFVW